MRKALAVLVALAAGPGVAGAGELEVAFYGGYTFPFYSQTFQYDPGPVEVPIPGVSVEQGGEFELKASGGIALGGAVTFYATDGFGFEVRLDSADLTVDTPSAGYTVRAVLPPPFDPVVSTLTLTGGTADLKALTPWSFNLKLRSGGNVRFTASGGLSRLGDLQFSIVQNVALGVAAVNLDTGNLEIATLRLNGVSSPDTKSTWGGNLGLGLQIPLGGNAALLLEGRGFYFSKRTIEWEPEIDTPLGSVEAALLERVRERLEPIEFEPWWVQASVGLAIRF